MIPGRQTRRTIIAEPSERQIYNSRRLLGTIATDGGGFWCAYDIEGHQLDGVHPSRRSATDARLAGAKAA
jgi:hypothetical protein